MDGGFRSVTEVERFESTVCGLKEVAAISAHTKIVAAIVRCRCGHFHYDWNQHDISIFCTNVDGLLCA